MPNRRSVIAQRLASASWQAVLRFNVALGACGGAYYTQIDGASLGEMILTALFFAAVTGAYTVVALRTRMAAVWALPGPDRRQVIDAVRFGRPIHDRHLAGPLLRYTARAAKSVRRLNAVTQIGAFTGGAGYAAYVAYRCGQVGRVGDTVLFAAVTVVLAGCAVVWPELARACRRNIAAAEESAQTLCELSLPLVDSQS